MKDLEMNSKFTKNTMSWKRKSGPDIWFNPPFSLSVITNICKYFLHSITKRFPKGHRFHKIFNRNNLELSYSTTRNMASHISAYNKNVLDSKKTFCISMPSPKQRNEGRSTCISSRCEYKPHYQNISWSGRIKFQEKVWKP